MSTTEEKVTVAIALGIVATIITCAIAFYGTIAYVVAHFIRKFW